MFISEQVKWTKFKPILGQLVLHDISGLMRIFVHGSLYDSQQQIIMVIYSNFSLF